MLIRHAGMDKIPAKFLKDVAYVSAYSMSNIIILTVKLFSWKIIIQGRHIKAIPKTTDIFHFQLQCPELLRNQCITNNNIILKGMTYSTNTSQVLEQYIFLFMSGLILIDFQKVFDTPDHKIFLKKMTCLGFKASVLKQPHPSNRTFCVSVKLSFLRKWDFNLQCP